MVNSGCTAKKWFIRNKEGNMPASTIIVQYRDGSAARNVRVVLGFTAGMTSDKYTDSRGHVVVEHNSIGKATVYVNGKEVEKFHAPGKCAVTLK